MGHYKYKKREALIDGEVRPYYKVLNPPTSFRGLQIILYNNGHGWIGLEGTTKKSVMPPSWRPAHSHKTRDGAIAILDEHFRNKAEWVWEEIAKQVPYKIKSEPLTV